MKQILAREEYLDENIEMYGAFYSRKEIKLGQKCASSL
jgi:hypothetical protein